MLNLDLDSLWNTSVFIIIFVGQSRFPGDHVHRCSEPGISFCLWIFVSCTGFVFWL